MKISHTERGFEYLGQSNDKLRVQQSSAVGDYDDNLEKPGSSFLWIGEAHMNKEEVKEIVDHLKAWLETGSLNLKP